MATVRVGYKRTFQTRPYETQVIDLAIEEESDLVKVKEPATILAGLYRSLDKIGDQLMAEALAKPDPAGRK